MSGHSKWHRIKRKKAAQDAKRGQEFTRLAGAIQAAARAGHNPDSNTALREAISQAKAANMPQSNIDRILERAGNTNAKPAIYEAFGPGGTAVLIHAVTDNSRRTVAELRSILKEHGGTLGEPGSVSWKFTPQVILTAPLPQTDVDSLELSLIDSGAADINTSNNTLTIAVPPGKQAAVESVLRQSNLHQFQTKTIYKPAVVQEVSTGNQEQLNDLMSSLADHPDVEFLFSDSIDHNKA